MLLRDLTIVWASKPTKTKDHGDYNTTWTYDSIAWFNLQQDFNELDRKSSGDVDYSIYKARTTQVYDIEKGDGISLTDISNSQNIVPEYRVIDITKIGNTYLYRLEKYNGED